MKFIVRSVGLLLLAMPLLLWSQGSHASLFEVSVGVQGEGTQERRRAAREGLGQVMQRLAGRKDVLDGSDAGQVLDKAEDMLQQFSYGQARNADGDEVRQISLRFDGMAVERAMIERGIAVWSPEDRPRMLVWMLEDRDGREIVGGDHAVDLQQQLRTAMSAQGLPMLLPLMDLEDQSALSTSALWGGFREPIMDASERYRPGAVVAVRLSRRDDRWQGRWQLFWDGNTHEVNVSDVQVEKVMAAGAEGIAGYLAGRLRGVPDRDAGGVVSVRILGMQSMADYAWMQDLLQGVRGVVASDPYRITASYTDFRISIEADSERILQTLENARRLERSERDMPGRGGEQNGSGRDERGATDRTPDYVFRFR